MILVFTSELNPDVIVKINQNEIYKGVANDRLELETPYEKGCLQVQMFNKNPKQQPNNKDMHIKLESIVFKDLKLDENKIYQLYDPVANNTKTLYLGFNAPEKLEVNIEHPYNKLIKRLAL
jgi:hypothetical protein